MFKWSCKVGYCVTKSNHCLDAGLQSPIWWDNCIICSYVDFNFCWMSSYTVTFDRGGDRSLQNPSNQCLLYSQLRVRQFPTGNLDLWRKPLKILALEITTHSISNLPVYTLIFSKHTFFFYPGIKERKLVFPQRDLFMFEPWEIIHNYWYVVYH